MPPIIFPARKIKFPTPNETVEYCERSSGLRRSRRNPIGNQAYLGLGGPKEEGWGSAKLLGGVP